MRTDRQTLLYDLPALVTFLTGETRVHSHDLMTSSCSLIFKDVKELTPRGVENALRQMMVFHHVGDLKVFNNDALIAFSIGLGRLEMVISALPVDLQMGLGDVTGCLPSSLRTDRSTAHRTLLAPKRSLRGAIETRVRNRVALAIGKEDFQSYVDADVRMGTSGRFMRSRWIRFADNQSIPVPISTTYQVYRLGSSLDLAMQLDLEEVTELLRHNQVFLILMQIAIFAVLPQLDGMPSVRLFETGKANTGNVVLLSLPWLKPGALKGGLW